MYEFDVVYEQGEIKAVSYKDGKIMGAHSIKTEGKASKISLTQEKSYYKSANKNGRKLIYVNVEAQDENGARATWDESEVVYSLEGGKILGAGSGNLETCEKYCDTVHKLYRGRTLVAVLLDQGASATLSAKSSTLKEAKIVLR